MEPTFQFLHLLVQTVAQLGDTLVVRADPPRTDERTINTLQPLFDAIVDTAEADDGTTPPALDTDTIHELLRNPRRRFVLRSLFQDESVGLETLAERLARRESGSESPTDDEQRRAFTALASVHVPRLAEAGLVVFERSDERVYLSDAARGAERLEGYLNGSFDGH